VDESRLYEALLAIHERLGKLDGIEKWMVQHSAEDNLLFQGDGSEDNPGLIKHVDRLIQADIQRRWLIRGLIGGIIACLVSPIKEVIAWAFQTH
jgi:hypothetical protein